MRQVEQSQVHLSARVHLAIADTVGSCGEQGTYNRIKRLIACMTYNR